MVHSGSGRFAAIQVEVGARGGGGVEAPEGSEVAPLWRGRAHHGGHGGRHGWEGARVVGSGRDALREVEWG